MAEPVSSLLRRSVGHLARRCPTATAACSINSGRWWSSSTSTARSSRCAVAGGSQVSDGAPGDAGARIATSRAAILDVLDARVGLERGGGSRHALTCAGRSTTCCGRTTRLLAYVHAAVRAPSQPGLLVRATGGTVMTEAMPTPASCDRRPTVAVLGAGIAGLTAAHELAERGFDVTVYEPRADERARAGPRTPAGSTRR